MATLKPSSTSIINPSLPSRSKPNIHKGIIIRSSINIPNHVRNISIPGLQYVTPDQKQLSPTEIINRSFKRTETNEQQDRQLITAKLYALLESVSDRVEMHKNIGDQRDNWNTLLLTSINALTLTAATMAAIAAVNGGAPASSALKISSTLMYVGATGMLSIMNKIQPSQLAEEQRNAARLFKQIQNQIKTILSIGNYTSFDVKDIMEKVLALDKAYPLPLLGAMLQKFPESVEPAEWWPEISKGRRPSPRGKNIGKYNGWNGKLEDEMREIVNVLERKDKEDYLRLGAKALKVNKFLGVAAPVLTGLAAVGSAMVGSHFDGGWAAVLAVSGGALASVFNSLEHGGQVGMVFEMYRCNAGFFQLMEETIVSNLREEELERRENGEVLELKVCLQLGRSLSQLRDLAEESKTKGEFIDEFASKLF